MKNDKKISDSIVINEVQLLLAEKRTSLSVMRTGITVLVLPLSVLSVLIATSKYYDIFHVMNMLIPLMIMNAILIILGSFLVVRSLLKIHHHDSLIQKLKKKHSTISEFIDWSYLITCQKLIIYFLEVCPFIFMIYGISGNRPHVVWLVSYVRIDIYYKSLLSWSCLNW